MLPAKWLRGERLIAAEDARAFRSRLIELARAEGLRKLAAVPGICKALFGDHRLTSLHGRWICGYLKAHGWRKRRHAGGWRLLAASETVEDAA